MSRVWKNASRRMRRIAMMIGLGALATAPALAQSTVLGGVASDAQLQKFGDYVTGACTSVRTTPPFGAVGSPGAVQPVGSFVPNPSKEQDLANRCNAAIRLANGSTADKALAVVALGQYAGLQNEGGQSDALVLSQRVDALVTARLSAVTQGMRSGQVARLSNGGRVQLASNNPQDAGYAGKPKIREHGFDGYLVGGWSSGQQDVTSRELGFDYDGFWVLAGGDVLLSDKMIVGAALSYSNAAADFDSSTALSLTHPGKLNTFAITGTVYGSYAITDRLDISGLVGYGGGKYKTTRVISLRDGLNAGDDATGNINRVARGDTDAHNWQAALSAYYELTPTGAVSMGPTAELSYYKGTTDGYSETGANGLNLSYGDQDQTSLRILLGYQASRNINTSFGTVRPYGRVRYIYETDDGVSSVNVRYTADPGTGSYSIATNPSDKNSFDATLGVDAQFANGIAAFVEAGSVFGLKSTEHYSISAGLKFEF